MYVENPRYFIIYDKNALGEKTPNMCMWLNFTDTKNSVGLVGCIEEVAHNAIAVYWNPLESTAKVSTNIYIFTEI